MYKGTVFLRLIAGTLFILAGLFAYYGIRTDFFLPLALVAAGGVIILIALTGYRPRAGDISLLIIALLIFGAVASGLGLIGPRETVTYSALRGQVDASEIDLTVSAEFGAIDISFSDDKNLAYRIDFARFFPFRAFQREEPDIKFTNETRGRTLFLNADSFAAEIRVTLGRGYITSVYASTTTGSISITTSRTEVLEEIILSTRTGSIDARVSAENIKKLSVETSTGSINLRSDYLFPGAAKVPITVSAGTGSVDFDIKILRSAAATLTASANIGIVHHDLKGFTILRSTGNRVEATAGDPAKTERSFEIEVSATTGSIDLDAEWSR